MGDRPTEGAGALGSARRGAGAGRAWIGVALSVLVVGGGLAFVVADSIDSAQYYRTIPETVSHEQELAGQHFRISGKVKPGSLESDSTGGLHHRFVLEEAGDTLVVVYDGALPDAFSEGLDVVVEGVLLQNGQFQADEVIARCPSKYEADRSPEAMTGSHPADVPKGGGR